MDIETPGIFLSFDDGWIEEWFDTLSLFERYGVKAIFYLSFGVKNGVANMQFRPDSDEWNMLKEITNKGHTIGYHTWEHLFANNLLPFIAFKDYKKREIDPGMKLLAEHGFKPRHFAYPYGWEACNDVTHQCLLMMFDTLRIEVRHEDWEVYEPESIKEWRLLSSVDVAKKKSEVLHGYIDRLVDEKKIGFLHGHNTEVIEPQLVDIFDYAKERNVRFYSMELLNRMEEKDAL